MTPLALAADLEANGSGIADVIAERERQKSVEGWTTEHDDEHDKGEMAAAAACYASPTRAFKVDKIVGPTYEEFWSYVDLWPWSHAWWKPKDRRRDLVRAAALIVAEIERLDRLAIKQAWPEELSQRESLNLGVGGRGVVE